MKTVWQKLRIPATSDWLIFDLSRVYRGRMSRTDAPAGTGEHPLREYRRRQGLKQAQLAHKCRLSASMISQIELGYVEPSLSTAYRIHLATGVSLQRMARFHANISGSGRR